VVESVELAVVSVGAGGTVSAGGVPVSGGVDVGSVELVSAGGVVVGSGGRAGVGSGGGVEIPTLGVEVALADAASAIFLASALFTASAIMVCICSGVRVGGVLFGTNVAAAALDAAPSAAPTGVAVSAIATAATTGV
jgi:hypothetical protein